VRSGGFPSANKNLYIQKNIYPVRIPNLITNSIIKPNYFQTRRLFADTPDKNPVPDAGNKPTEKIKEPQQQKAPQQQQQQKGQPQKGQTQPQKGQPAKKAQEKKEPRVKMPEVVKDIDYTKIDPVTYTPLSPEELSKLRFDELWDVSEVINLPRVTLEEVGWYLAKKDYPNATVINMEKSCKLTRRLIRKNTGTSC